MSSQLDLFSGVLSIYKNGAGEAISNNQLYKEIGNKLGLTQSAFDVKSPVGESEQKHSLLKRKLRWFQQSLKQAGVIERVAGERGVWKLTEPAGHGLSKILPNYSIVGFSTKLGVAIVGSCKDVFAKISEPLELIISSPPYPLSTARNYGNPTEKEFVDWICETIAPLIGNMADGASLCLNLGADIFMPKSPARSMYKERLILALNDNFGLHLMDNIIWQNPSKPPGPIAWASKQRFQLNGGYENIIWMCNNPLMSFADNRRVLEPHSEQHLKLMKSGGEFHARINSDGAHRIKAGSYAKLTEGKIPRNILNISHNCKDQRDYKVHCLENGLTPHGAAMPLKLALFLIKFLSRTGQLIADPFGGSFTTAKAAELLSRRWISTDIMLEYVVGGASRFNTFDGFQQNIRLS